jgi:xanthine dehydrogenase molybdenum-binding subunit
MTNIVGQSVPRIDAKDKVTGEALYSGDLVMPGMLHMKILFANRPHARVVNIDATKAEAYPGVAGVCRGHRARHRRAGYR